VEFGDKGKWIVTLPCVACRVSDSVQVKQTVPAHCSKTRGAGARSDRLMPLCVDHENEFHNAGRDTFSARYHLDLAGVEFRYELEWIRIQGGAA
jgi:hypothetical protein